MRANWKRKMLTTAIALIGGYFLLAALVMFGQRKMIYHPTTFAAGGCDKIALGHNLKPWTNAIGERIGWMRSSSANGTGQVLIVHGNAGCAVDRIDFAESLQTIDPDLNIFILEYPGYGDRLGPPSQSSLLKAAEEAFDLLAKNGPLFIVGESLGTGVASYLAGKYSNSVAGLMLFCPYNNLSSVARHHMAIFPTGWLLWDRFPSDTWLRAYHGPVGVLVAEHDQVVPPRFGRLLYEGYHGPKKLWEIAGAGHNDVFDRPDEWWREVLEFWRTKDQPSHASKAN